MKTCLVVDDSSVIRKVARRILEGLDFQIVEAEDGEQALEECRKQLPEAILRILRAHSTPVRTNTS
jgi:two-component system, chemotaxis family, chemotaxis protein CheY